MTVTEFATIEDFWLDDLDRWASPEADYGVHWRDSGQQGWWPEWRVSYIRDTGEVYAVRQHGSPIGPVRLLGVVPADPVADRDRETYYRTLDAILDGWADPEITGHDLAWISGRLEAAGRGARRATGGGTR